jgi:hypothetical protein
VVVSLIRPVPELDRRHGDPCLLRHFRTISRLAEDLLPAINPCSHVRVRAGAESLLRRRRGNQLERYQSDREEHFQKVPKSGKSPVANLTL